MPIVAIVLPPLLEEAPRTLVNSQWLLSLLSNEVKPMWFDRRFKNHGLCVRFDWFKQ